MKVQLLASLWWPRPYLLFVIFFTRAKFLENKIYTKIYTVNCQFTQEIANLHSKWSIFRVKSVKIYTGQRKFTRAPPVAPVTNMRCGFKSDDIPTTMQELFEMGQGLEFWHLPTSQGFTPRTIGSPKPLQFRRVKLSSYTSQISILNWAQTL